MPICPHTLAHRPLVMADDSEVEFVLRTSGEMFVTLDGQYGRELCTGDRVLVTRASSCVALIRENGVTYYEVLRDKLKWGER